MIVYLSYTIMDKSFDCILPVYELGIHGWLCTYHIWVIWVCRAWLMVYFSYTIMVTCLIEYFPCMSLEYMVDCAHTIYEWYKFVGNYWFYTHRIRLWEKLWLYTHRKRVWGNITVYELGRHSWLCTYRIWVIWVCMTWLIVFLLYTIMEKCLLVYLPCMSLEDMCDCALTVYEW